MELFVLSHIRSDYIEIFDVKKDAKKYYKCHLLVAKDLMKIKI